jgi:hypothetical protein
MKPWTEIDERRFYLRKRYEALLRACSFHEADIILKEMEELPCDT